MAAEEEAAPSYDHLFSGASNEWQDAPLSLDDPATAVVTEIGFLKSVSTHNELTRPGSVLANAVRRYETLWLPLMLKQGKDRSLVPPLDVHWVWHCHMLSPVWYKNDCMKLLGSVPDHVVREPVLEDAALTKLLWESEYQTEPYDWSSLETLLSYEQQCSYNLTEACLRQGTFYYNVSLPHYKDEAFLANAIIRYKKFLYLRKMNLETFIVPCYDVDIVWHTHQLHPVVYASDTQSYLGCLFNHDDTDTDRGPTSKLSSSDAETRSLWKATFSEEFSLPGAMYRGPPPNSKLAVLTAEQVSNLCSRKGSITLSSIRIERPRSQKLKLCISSNGKPCETLKHSARKGARRRDTVVWSGDSLATISYDSSPRDSVLFEVVSSTVFQCFDPYGGSQVCQFDVLEFQPNDGGDVGEERPFRLQRQFDSSSLLLQGSVVTKDYNTKVLLILKAGHFETVTMPETVEQLWGPIPLGKLPAGVANTCIVASHRVFAPRAPNRTAVKFTVRVIHCLPLLMSAVQVFAADKMVAVSHLVGLDQIPDSRSHAIKCKDQCITLDWSAGERGMVIKNSGGDWGFVFGSWANMKRGIPGTRQKKGVRGNPGNLRVRYVPLSATEKSATYDLTKVKKFQVKIAGTELDLKSGQMVVDCNDIAERVALAFSVAVLNVLCQPPPPGAALLDAHGEVGRALPDPRLNMQPVSATRGNRAIGYVDAGSLALVSAAGWHLPTPCNYYMGRRAQSLRRQSNGSSRHHYPSLDTDTFGAFELGIAAGLLIGVGDNSYMQAEAPVNVEWFPIACDSSAGCGGCGGGGYAGSSCGGAFSGDNGADICGADISAAYGGGDNYADNNFDRNAVDWNAGDSPADWCAGDSPADWCAGDSPADWCAGDSSADGCAGDSPPDLCENTSYGDGGVASDCGGGVSSCAGATSSCGGGGSTCGGGGSTCGGGGSTCGGGGSTCGGGGSSCGGGGSSCGGS